MVRRRVTTRLWLRRLENRTVPTIYTVNALTDLNSGSGNAGDLRYCVSKANADASIGPHTIDLSGLAGTITLQSGQITIGATQDLILNGPGAATLTISAAAATSTTNRIFNITSSKTITISNLKLANGNLSSGNGGAILTTSKTSLALSGVTIVNNKTASGSGGAVYFTGASSGTPNLSLTNATFESNSASVQGGAVYVNSANTGITIADSTFSGNTAATGAAAIYVFHASPFVTITGTVFSNNQGLANYFGSGIVLTMNNCTYSGNLGAIYQYTGKAAITSCTFVNNSALRGGAIFLDYVETVINNCTILNNTATSAAFGGGAIFVYSSSNLTINNSTILGNSTAGRGGGIFMYNGSLSLRSSIVAENTASNGQDISISGGKMVEASDNVIGVGDEGGFTLGSPNQAGTAVAPLNPLVGSLATNGGPTLTIGLLPGSPALDMGSNPAGLSTDQRGPGFPRVINGTPDVGAFEGMLSIPSALMTYIPDVVSVGSATPNSIGVTYADDVAIDVSKIDVNDIQITGPNSSVLSVTSASLDIATDGTPRKVTYTFDVPGGNWDLSDNGIYTVSMVGGEVADADPIMHYVQAGILNTFRIAVPITITVDATNDESTDTDGKTSLREALSRANSDKISPDTITFDPTVFGSPQTIKLASGELNVQGNTIIQGPGADRLVIDAGGLSRVFNFSNESASHAEMSLIGVRVTNGNGYGSGLYVADEHLTLDSVWITNNYGGARSGGIQQNDQSKLVILNSTISGNSASGPGGGIYSSGRQIYLLIRNSTISNNTSSIYNSHGGGLYISAYYDGANVRIENSTITGNRSDSDGGAIWISKTVGTNSLTIESSIVAGNTAGTGVGADICEQTVAETVTAINSFIGVGDSGFTLTKQGTTVAGTKNSPANPQLGLLQNNGGAVPTHMPSAASTVRDLGSNPSGLPYDQRGMGFPRVLQGGVDIGAVESMSNNPTGTMKGIDPIWQPGPTPNTIQVTYKDATAVDWTSIDKSDIQVLNPNSIPLSITGVSLDAQVNGPTRVATYTFSVPGGGWDLSDNGSYKVYMQASQVANTSAIYVPASKLGDFTVSFGRSFLVTNTADSNSGSLRQAVLDANASVTAGPDTITFAVAGKITLASDLVVTDDVEVHGNGGVQLTRTKGGHIFQIDNSIFTISKVTLRDSDPFGASSSSGGAIFSSGTLTIRDCVFSGNGGLSSGLFYRGGAISHTGTAIIERTTFQNNMIYGQGGALSVSGSATIKQCTFNGNAELGSTAGGVLHSGGGALFVFGNLTIDDSTFNGNSAFEFRSWGGALNVNGSATIRNTTFYGNSANSGGAIYNEGGTLTLQNCTITGNSAYDGPFYAGYGGGIKTFDTVILQSTIVSGNTDADAPDIQAKNETVQADHSAIGSLTGITTYIDSGNNLAPGTDLKLGGFGNNGGPTNTVALQSTSPAINAGSNAGKLDTDQRGVGYYRAIGKTADIGAYEYQNLPAVVTSVIVNDGSPQRSIVKSLTVTFDRPLSLTSSAFKLLRSDNAEVTLSGTMNGKSITLMFTNGPLENGSLADGKYTLTAFAALIGNFDGNGDTIAGDDFTFQTHRLFGDADGNATVNSDDFAAFRSSFGIAGPTFDFNNDGVVNSDDFAEFRKRFGITIVP